MRWILRLLFLAVLLYAVLPYYSLYRLNHALMVDDMAQLNQYIDLEQIKESYKRGLRIEQGGGTNSFTGMLRGTANSMSALTVEQLVTVEWVRRELTGAKQGEVGGSLYDRLDHAFFEAPCKFLVRLGTLEESPSHLIFMRDGWNWRLTSIYQ